MHRVKKDRVGEGLLTALAGDVVEAELDDRGLQPFDLTGPELDAFVKKQVGEYRAIANEFGLVKK